MTQDTSPRRYTPRRRRKVRPFAGWSMPLTYPAGVMKEHLHVREHAGLFDISHMKLFEVDGADAVALLDRACPLDAGAIAASQSNTRCS